MFANELSSRFTRREKWTRHICPSSPEHKSVLLIMRMFYVFCAKLVLDDLFSHLFHKIPSSHRCTLCCLWAHSTLCAYAFSFSSLSLSTSLYLSPGSSLPHHARMRICLNFNWRWHPCSELPACMRVFLRLLILLCQLIGYVFLFFSLFFSLGCREAQAYRKRRWWRNNKYPKQDNIYI